MNSFPFFVFLFLVKVFDIVRTYLLQPLGSFQHEGSFTIHYNCVHRSTYCISCIP